MSAVRRFCAFRKEVFRLVRGSPDALRDYRYRDQLRNAAGGISKHITEGYLRFSPLDFARFLDYALGSLGEAERRLRDGVELDYFKAADCREAFQFAKRCFVAARRLKESQIRYAEGLRPKERRRRKPKPAPRRPHSGNLNCNSAKDSVEGSDNQEQNPSAPPGCNRRSDEPASEKSHRKR
ncbi:MAG: four helix bundle protein [Acidobacteriota bacterium]